MTAKARVCFGSPHLTVMRLCCQRGAATGLGGRELLGELEVVHAGHTEGCIVLYSPSRKVIFTGDVTGDVILNRDGLTGPIPEYSVDLAQAHQSLREKIAPLDFELCCFAHGGVMAQGAGDRVREVIAGVTV